MRNCRSDRLRAGYAQNERRHDENERRAGPREPDASGVYIDESAFLVHRRLIVIDPENGAQPMSTRIYTLVYNGELYNTSELRRELQASGVEFTGIRIPRLF